MSDKKKWTQAEIETLTNLCEAGIESFTNDQMSTALVAISDLRKYGAPVSGAQALSFVKNPCTKHNHYWTTASGACMACRADDAAAEIEQLRRIIAQLHPYSRRYCDGRSTYAPSDHNQLTDQAIALGCKIDPDPIAKSIYAKDGTFDEPRPESEQITQLRTDLRTLAAKLRAFACIPNCILSDEEKTALDRAGRGS